MVIPNTLEDKQGRFLISLEADVNIDYDFFCAIIFLDIDTIVESDVLEILPGKVFVCRDEMIFNSALRKGIVLGVIFNGQFN